MPLPISKEELLKNYKSAAAKYGICSEDGDSRNGNKAYEILEQTFTELNVIGKESRLLELLNDDNKWVSI